MLSQRQLLYMQLKYVFYFNFDSSCQKNMPGANKYQSKDEFIYNRPFTPISGWDQSCSKLILQIYLFFNVFPN